MVKIFSKGYYDWLIKFVKPKIYFIVILNPVRICVAFWLSWILMEHILDYPQFFSGGKNYFYRKNFNLVKRKTYLSACRHHRYVDVFFHQLGKLYIMRNPHLKSLIVARKTIKFIFLLHVYIQIHVVADCDMFIRDVDLGAPTILVYSISAVFNKLKPRTVVCYAWIYNIPDSAYP